MSVRKIVLKPIRVLVHGSSEKRGTFCMIKEGTDTLMRISVLENAGHAFYAKGGERL